MPGVLNSNLADYRGRLRPRLDARRRRQGLRREVRQGQRPAGPPDLGAPRLPRRSSPARTSMPSSSARPTSGTRSSRWPRSIAGKDVYLQKPMTMTVEEGIAPARVRRRLAPDPPGGQPAAVVDPVQAGLRVCAQRPRRPRDGRRDRAAGRPDRPGRPAAARAFEPRLRPVARAHRRGLLHGAEGASAEGLQPAGLAPQRVLLPGHDHRLGRPPLRHRPLGAGLRALRPRAASRGGPSSPRTKSGTCTGPTMSSSPIPTT